MAHPTEAELRSLGNEILDLLVAQTIKETESYFHAREATGTTNVEGIGGPDGQIVPVQQVVEDYVRDTYGFLPDTFADFAEPRPEEFDDAISQCIGATMILEPNLDRIQQEGLGQVGAPGRVWPDPSYVSDAVASYPTTVVERLSDVTRRLTTWSGNAADEFNAQYLNEFPHALENQNAAVFALAITLDANKRIFEYVGNDILLVGEKTKEALRNVTDKDPRSYTVPLMVGAAVASVISAGAAAPAAAAGFALLAQVGAGAAAFVDATADEGDPPEIDGVTTQEIMMSMMGRINEVHQLVSAEEDKIVGCLTAVHEWLTDSSVREQTELRLPAGYMGLDGASYDEIRTEFLHT